MIPKPLAEIEWADIEALRNSGREEDDTIEFKGSFSGGSDFLAFSEKQQAAAVDGIAKEAIAFLNARGGDIVVGVTEYKNDHPRIETITPVENVSATSDRLAQSLAALIEPAQSVLSVRAVKQCPSASGGVIVVRAQASFRAPHRSKRTKECYSRRGRESVPMAMDEVQDLSIRRADLRSQRLETLDRFMRSTGSNPTGRINLPDQRFHMRAAFVPSHEQQIQIDDELCTKLRGVDPVLVFGDKCEQISVPFRELEFRFSTILRGRRSEKIKRNFRAPGDFMFCSKDIRESGVLTADFACWVELGSNQQQKWGLYHSWIAGFAANALTSFQRVAESRPELREGFLGIAFYVCGQVVSRLSEGHWTSDADWPQGLNPLPTFEINSSSDFSDAITQVQTDAGSIVGVGDQYNWIVAD